MHPIFSHLRRLGLYLLAWIPIAGMLAYLLTIPGQITMREAVTLSIPLSLIYAFVCLSSWYSCRGNSLEKYGLGRSGNHTRHRRTYREHYLGVRRGHVG
jgi:hypothetical protein